MHSVPWHPSAVIDFGILAMDTILNEVCVLVTAAFALTLVPGFRRQERSLPPLNAIRLSDRLPIGEAIQKPFMEPTRRRCPVASGDPR
jgi:hypothetical protein